jgi:phage portal protein BeeE
MGELTSVDIARIFGVPHYVVFGPSASIRRRRERLSRMHAAYRRRRR